MDKSWIPVDSHDLPFGAVLVWDGSDQLVASQIGGIWREIMTGLRLRGVTHYHRLPKPPVEVS